MTEDPVQDEAHKRAVLDRIYEIWRQRPHLRLGQLLVNSLRDSTSEVTERRIFYIDDYALMELLEKWEPR